MNIQHSISKWKLAARSRSAFTGAVAGLAVGLQMSAFADSQGYPSTEGQCTNIPAAFANVTASAPGANTLVLHNTGLAYDEVFQGANLMTGPVTTWFYPTLDGSNYFSAPWATLVVNANGTNTVCAGTNWDQLKLRGFTGMAMVISNGTGGGVIGFGPGGTVTNASSTFTNIISSGANWSRPNQ